jgi:hypothetical protein
VPAGTHSGRERFTWRRDRFRAPPTPQGSPVKPRRSAGLSLSSPITSEGGPIATDGWALGIMALGMTALGVRPVGRAFCLPQAAGSEMRVAINSQTTGGPGSDQSRSLSERILRRRIARQSFRHRLAFNLAKQHRSETDRSWTSRSAPRGTSIALFCSTQTRYMAFSAVIRLEQPKCLQVP